MDLKELYRDVILAHNKRPRNFGRLDPCDSSAEGHNPLCGDQLSVSLRLDGDRISDLKFDGHGCAISVASASMMTEAAKGLDRGSFGTLHDKIHHMLTEHDSMPPVELGKLAALAGVREFPARVKCASLSWRTLEAALKHSSQPVSTE
jgi:nitrogen fixation protein NifU and related proteins